MLLATFFAPKVIAPDLQCAVVHLQKDYCRLRIVRDNDGDDNVLSIYLL